MFYRSLTNVSFNQVETDLIAYNVYPPTTISLSNYVKQNEFSNDLILIIILPKLSGISFKFNSMSFIEN